MFSSWELATTVICSGCGTGSGLSRIALTTLNSAVLAPIPRPRVITTMMVSAGVLASMRRP